MRFLLLIRLLRSHDARMIGKSGQISRIFGAGLAHRDLAAAIEHLDSRVVVADRQIAHRAGPLRARVAEFNVAVVRRAGVEIQVDVGAVLIDLDRQGMRRAAVLTALVGAVGNRDAGQLVAPLGCALVLNAVMDA